MSIKKITALICMLMCFLSVPVYSQNNEYSETVQKLTALNIIPEQSDENKFVTRGELAKYTCYLLGITDYNGYSFVYRDVNKTDVNAPYIAIVSGLGYMQGVGDNLFLPDEFATLDMVYNVFSAAIGYKKMAYGTNELSSVKSSMFKNISLKTNDYVNVEEIAQIIWNTLDMKALEFEDRSVSVGNENMLWKYHKIYCERGMVTANEYTHLENDTAVAEGYVQIDDVLFKNGTDYLNDMLGQHIKFYYKHDENSNDDVILYAESDKGKILEIRDHDIEFVDRSNFEYSEGKKVKRAKLSPVLNVIYNGKYLAAFREEDLQPEIGNVILVDCDGDSVFETAIVKSYITYIVKSIDTENRKIYDEIFQPSVCIPDQAKLRVYKSGQLAAFEDIEEKNILLIAADRYCDNDGEIVIDSKLSTIYEILVSDAVVNGKPERRYDEFVEISGEQYRVSSLLEKNNKQILLSTEAVFYLDYLGNIAWTDSGDSQRRAKGTYGFITRAWMDDLEENVYIRLFDENSEWHTYMIADKVCVDGKGYKNKTMAFNVITAGNRATISGGKNGGQMVLFTVNEDDQIDYIDTVVCNPGESKDSSLSIDMELGNATYYYNTFNRKSTAIGKCMLIVPRGESANTYDATDEAAYKWESVSIFGDGGGSYTIQTFNENKYGIVEKMIYLKDFSGTIPSKTPGMISEIKTCLNSDDEIVTAVTVVGNSDTKTYNITEQTLLVENYSLNQKLKVSDLKIGDLISYETNGENFVAVNRAFTLYDEDNNLTGYNDGFGQASNYIRHMVWGQLYSISPQNLRVLCASSVSDIENMFSYYTSGRTLILYDETGRKINVSKVSSDAIRDYCTVGSIESADKVLLFNRYGSNQAVFIYRIR